jgi:hypothetical protein
MIHDLDKTLEKLLYTKGNLNRNDVDIVFDTPDREWASRLGRPTLSCWAFDIRENMKLRSMERQVVRNGDTASVLFPSIRIDVSYLITAWARKMEDEHQLIWRALAALRQTPTITPADGEGMLRYQRKDIPMLVATPSDHPVNLADLWGVLDNVMHLGFTLVATLELDTALADYEAPITAGRQIRTNSLDRDGNVEANSSFEAGSRRRGRAASDPDDETGNK